MSRSTLSGLRTRIAGLGIAAAAAALVVGCGSSGGNTANPGGSSGAPTGSTIKFGVIGSVTGSQASSSSQGSTVGPAWAKWVNANGGINGHQVEVMTADDKGDPVAAAAAAKDLISANVAAIVVASDNLVPAYDGDVIKAGIPLVGGSSNSTDWYQKAGMYPTATYKSSGNKAQLLVAKDLGKATKVANVFCSEVAACASSNDFYAKTANELGLQFTKLAVSSTATSYTSQCLSLKEQKVDYALLSISASVGAKFVQDCQAQGYDPGWGTNVQSIGPALLGIPKVTMYGPAYVFPSVADAPQVKTFTDAMTKYAKDDNWHEGSAGFTWSGLEVIRKALSGVGASDNVTGQTVKSGLESLKDDNIGGLMANKLTFTAGVLPKLDGNPCYFIVQVKDGKTIAPNQLNPVCPSS